MRNRLRSLLLAGLVALALVVGLGWLVLRLREPVYEGNTLSEWLTPGTNGFEAGTEDAVRHIGTNAIPTLLRMLRAQDSKLKLQLIGVAERQHFVKLHFVSAYMRNAEATMAFSFLGPVASNAVPALIQIFDEKDSLESQENVIASLSSIGPAASAAVPELVRYVGNTNADRSVRYEAVSALAQIHADLELVVPALIKCLNDPDQDFRLKAEDSLEALGSDAKTAVPALLDLLKDPNPDLRHGAMRAIQAIDPRSVIDLLKDPDWFVRAQAEDALGRIDPEAAAKAGIK
jgi:HEAT repeat protein